jgi:hypothetical protein
MAVAAVGDDILKYMIMIVMFSAIIGCSIWFGVELIELRKAVKSTSNVDDQSVAAMRDMSQYMLAYHNQMANMRQLLEREVGNSSNTIGSNNASNTANNNFLGLQTDVKDINKLLQSVQENQARNLTRLMEKQSVIYDTLTRTPYCVVPSSAAAPVQAPAPAPTPAPAATTTTTVSK